MQKGRKKCCTIRGKKGERMRTPGTIRKTSWSIWKRPGTRTQKNPRISHAEASIKRTARCQQTSRNDAILTKHPPTVEMLLTRPGSEVRHNNRRKPYCHYRPYSLIDSSPGMVFPWTVIRGKSSSLLRTTILSLRLPTVSRFPSGRMLRRQMSADTMIDDSICLPSLYHGVRSRQHCFLILP